VSPHSKVQNEPISIKDIDEAIALTLFFLAFVRDYRAAFFLNIFSLDK
jgi:hypothetical protein